jgi:hypothetical protein
MAPIFEIFSTLGKSGNPKLNHWNRHLAKKAGQVLLFHLLFTRRFGRYHHQEQKQDA